MWKRIVGATSSSGAGTEKPPGPTSFDFNIWPWLRETYNFQTLLDIGAADGDFGAFIARYLNIRTAHFFEPLDLLRVKLEAHAEKITEATVHTVALCAESGTADFLMTEHRPSSSLLPLSREGATEFPQIGEAKTIPVTTARIDDVLENVVLPNDIFIKMDVQGVEDQVIEGGRRTFGAARAALVEATFFRQYENQCLFQDVNRLLEETGLFCAGVRNQILSEENFRPLFAHFIYVRP